MQKNYIIKCSCFSPHHHIQVCIDTEDHYVYMHTQLNAGSLWTRLKIAFKYICGGNFQGYEEVVLHKQDIAILKEVINELEK